MNMARDREGEKMKMNPEEKAIEKVTEVENNRMETTEADNNDLGPR